MVKKKTLRELGLHKITVRLQPGLQILVFYDDI